MAVFLMYGKQRKTCRHSQDVDALSETLPVTKILRPATVLFQERSFRITANFLSSQINVLW